MEGGEKMDKNDEQSRGKMSRRAFSITACQALVGVSLVGFLTTEVVAETYYSGEEPEVPCVPSESGSGYYAYD
jgi:hypothetical protein